MKRDIFHVIVSILAGMGMGFVAMAILPPTPVVAPTPAVAPPDRDLVVGLSEVLVDVHKEAVATKAELAGVKPPLMPRRRVDPLRMFKMTVGEHYQNKRSHYGVSYPNTWDVDLRRLFGDPTDDPRRGEAASAFLRRNRAQIRELVSRWTGEYQFTLDTVLTDMIGRCRELKLRAVGSERRLKLDFTVLLTVKTMHMLYSTARREWIPL